MKACALATSRSTSSTRDRRSGSGKARRGNQVRLAHQRNIWDLLGEADRFP